MFELHYIAQLTNSSMNVIFIQLYSDIIIKVNKFIGPFKLKGKIRRQS